jgi:hypothetical protein
MAKPKRFFIATTPLHISAGDPARKGGTLVASHGIHSISSKS